MEFDATWVLILIYPPPWPPRTLDGVVARKMTAACMREGARPGLEVTFRTHLHVLSQGRVRIRILDGSGKLLVWSFPGYAFSTVR